MFTSHFFKILLVKKTSQDVFVFMLFSWFKKHVSNMYINNIIHCNEVTDLTGGYTILMVRILEECMSVGFY